MRGVAGILESGGGDFTFRVLAEVSGVAERTIYRRYATKEAVFAAFWIWLNERLGMPAPPKSPQELVAQVPVLFEAFEAGEPLVRAMLHDVHGRATRLAGRQTRQARFRGSLKEILNRLEPADQTRLLASVQVLSSAAGWETMKDYWDITSVEAADAAQWAIGALLAQAQRQARPAIAAPGKQKKG